MKKIANIGYLKELYKNINGGQTPSTKVPVDVDTYCPTYKEITSGKYFDYSDGTTKGLMVGTQYSVDETVGGKYEDNQCVCEIDILAVIPRLVFLKVIDKDTLTYKDWATVDCMVDFEELSTGKTPYSDQPYLKLQLECDNYQKKDDGKKIEYSRSIVDMPIVDKNGRRIVTFEGSGLMMKDNLSTQENKYELKTKVGNRYSNEIEITQAGETYGFYDKDGMWVDADTNQFSNGNSATKGWLDDYGDNIGTENGGRDVYNLDNTDYRRGIEITTNIQPYTYTKQSNKNDSSKYKVSLPTYNNSKTYHIAFADDISTLVNINDSHHWLFREENASVDFDTLCDNVGINHSYNEGTTTNAYYKFEYHRHYFKPQHCYGKTSIDRIYKLDKNGQYILNDSGNKILDKGYDDNGIDHLDGNGSKYPKHWRRQVAYYWIDEKWEDITGDTLSKAKITVFERVYTDSPYKPSHRSNGNVSKMADSNYINFPDNKGGAHKYYAYPFYHFLSKEQCVFNDDKKIEYHRDETKNSVKNYETGKEEVYPYNVSAYSNRNIRQDNGLEYLTYYTRYGDRYSYGNKYCSSTQKTMPITLYTKWEGNIWNIVTKDEVLDYIKSEGKSGNNKRKPRHYSKGASSIITDYRNTKDSDGRLESNKETFEHNYNVSYVKDYDFPDDITKCKEVFYDYEKKGWNTTDFYFPKRKDNSLLEQESYDATVPYQTGEFKFIASPNNTVTAKITGELSQYATTKITYDSGNGGDGTVEVKIDYGVAGKEAKIGNLVITDKEGHTLTFPITYDEKITMGQARKAASTGYVAINGGTSDKSDNYWCTSKDGKGDAGKEFLKFRKEDE